MTRGRDGSAGISSASARPQGQAGLQSRWLLFMVLLSSVGCSPAIEPQTTHRGDEASPLRVLLVPADGGTQDGTIADFAPVFRAITASSGLQFDIKVGQSYAGVVEGMVAGKVDIAFFGPVTYDQARSRGAAELLAVGVTAGQSVYYAGIFVATDSPVAELADLQGRSLALGDINSTSSFNFPVAMLLEANIDPVQDLGALFLTGSHANALMALSAGKVDAACASLSSFEKAVNSGQLDPGNVRLLAKSDPIPYPPLAMRPKLDAEIKSRLREAFHNVHNGLGVSPEMIRGYGGKRVDRYTTDISDAIFDEAMSKLQLVTDSLKAEILKKSAAR